LFAAGIILFFNILFEYLQLTYERIGRSKYVLYFVQVLDRNTSTYPEQQNSFCLTWKKGKREKLVLWFKSNSNEKRH